MSDLNLVTDESVDFWAVEHDSLACEALHGDERELPWCSSPSLCPDCRVGR